MEPISEPPRKSLPDGYTILLMDPAIVINPTLQVVPYDLSKQLETVSVISSSPEVLVVAPQLNVNTFAKFVDYAKANPGKLNFASAGVGTTPHLAAELFKQRTGIVATHVPYKGIGASYTDLMTNKVQFAFSSIAVLFPSRRARKSYRSPRPALRAVLSTLTGRHFRKRE